MNLHPVVLRELRGCGFQLQLHQHSDCSTTPAPPPASCRPIVGYL